MDLDLWNAKAARRERWSPVLLGGAMICYAATGLMALMMLLG